MVEPLLLIDISNPNILCKGKSDRNGLIQQIVTYVRDGKTITRKQWVRSEFAEHAKQNEEEKKKALIRKMERDRKKHEKDIQISKEEQEKRDNAERLRIERERLQDRQDNAMSEEEKEIIRHKKKLSKLSKEEQEKREKNARKLKRDEESRNSSNKDSKSRFGQEEKTRADSRQQSNEMLQRYKENATL